MATTSAFLSGCQRMPSGQRPPGSRSGSIPRPRRCCPAGPPWIGQEWRQNVSEISARASDARVGGARRFRSGERATAGASRPRSAHLRQNHRTVPSSSHRTARASSLRRGFTEAQAGQGPRDLAAGRSPGPVEKLTKGAESVSMRVAHANGKFSPEPPPWAGAFLQRSQMVDVRIISSIAAFGKSRRPPILTVGNFFCCADR